MQRFRRVKVAAATLGLFIGPLGLAGCGGDDQGDAAKTAEKALGVDQSKGASTTTTTKHDLIVTEEKKVQDRKTGEVLSDEKTVTPVTVEKDVKTDYKAKTGTTQAAPAPKP